MKLLKAMATIASFTMLSRIAGMVRDMLTASMLGAGALADAFFVALKLPNFFRRIAGEGAFSVSFIPIYSKTMEQEGEDEAAKFAGQVFSIMSIILCVFTAIMMLIMPWVINVIAPGFREGTERYDLAVILTQITFPYLLLMSLTALFGGMLNTHGKFAPFSAAPIIFNVTIILALLGFSQFFPSAAHAMAIGVTVSGVLQLGMMIYFIKRHKIKFLWQRPQLSEKTKHLFKLMGPGVLAAGVFQVNLFADMMIASLLPSGAISYLYYADRLNQLPLSMVGIAVGTALLPMLSRALSCHNQAESHDLYNRSLEFCFFAALPAAVALLIIPFQMVSTLFEHGKFTATDSLTTSYVLMGYGIGLPAYVASKIFMTVFWAHQDTVTPVKIAILTALSNIALSLLLIGWLGVAGIALATGLVGWLQVYLLRRKLKEKITLEFDDRLKDVFPKMAVCSAIMGVVLFLVSSLLEPYFEASLPIKIMALVGLIASGGIAYLIGVQVTGVLRLSDIKRYLKRSKDTTPAVE
jgi:putative peptidoglycan lipid II flippase